MLHNMHVEGRKGGGEVAHPGLVSAPISSPTALPPQLSYMNPFLPFHLGLRYLVAAPPLQAFLYNRRLSHLFILNGSSRGSYLHRASYYRWKRLGRRYWKRFQNPMLYMLALAYCKTPMKQKTQTVSRSMQEERGSIYKQADQTPQSTQTHSSTRRPSCRSVNVARTHPTTTRSSTIPI